MVGNVISSVVVMDSDHGAFEQIIVHAANEAVDRNQEARHSE